MAKILYGITKSNFGGAQRYVYELARESKACGNDTAVLLGGSGSLKDKLESRGVRVISLSSLGRNISIDNDIKEFFSIIKTLKKEKPDVFHVNSSKMGGMGALAGRIAGVPKIVFTAHAWALNEDRPLYQKTAIAFLHWLTILLAHETICVSEKTKNNIAHWPFIQNKLHVVHNGIMPFELIPRDTARTELGIKPDTYVVGTIAELHRVKGLDILLRAWFDFIKTNPQSTLVIIGDGEEGENLNTLAKKLKIENSVYFAGFVDNARKYLLAFDVFVLASRSEALPYAPLEAGFAFLPVVATSVGGVPEIIKEGETGLLVEPEFPIELCHVLNGLSNDPTLRKTLGENLHEFVNQEFNMRDMFEKTFSLYKN